MGHVFISHSAEDQETVVALAAGLQAAGFATWYYERDSLPGGSYLLQTARAVQDAAVVILLISKTSIKSEQVTREVVRGAESRKRFIPILCGITHAEFQEQQDEWREALGATVTLPLPAGGAAAIVPKLVSALKAWGVAPGAAAPPHAPVAASAAPKTPRVAIGAAALVLLGIGAAVVLRRPAL